MIGRPETKLIFEAFKDWFNDTPLRIRGWVVSLIVFLGGVTGISIWLAKNLPPWWVWISAVAIIFGVICLSFIPYYKRYKSRIKPPINKVELINAIANAKKSIDNYCVFMNSMRKMEHSGDNKIFDKKEAGQLLEEFDKVSKEYQEALNSFDKQILIAGIDYEKLLNPLFMMMQLASMQHLGKWRIGQQDTDYLHAVDKYTKETMSKIRDL
jgi:MFS family permease